MYNHPFKKPKQNWQPTLQVEDKDSAWQRPICVNIIYFYSGKYIQIHIQAHFLSIGV